MQEFIKEAGGADIRAFIVDGQVVGAMKRQGKEGEFRSNLHRVVPLRLSNYQTKRRLLPLKLPKLWVSRSRSRYVTICTRPAHLGSTPLQV